jgi:hypothetical protein
LEDIGGIGGISSPSHDDSVPTGARVYHVSAGIDFARARVSLDDKAEAHRDQKSEIKNIEE